MHMTRLTPVVVAVVLVAGACSSADPGPAGDQQEPAPQAGGTTEQTSTEACFEEGESGLEAQLYIEHNSTDEDTGFHGLLGHDGMATACLMSPDGTPLMVVEPRGPLGDLGLNQMFFESREPPNAEYSIADLKTDFPEGDYRVSVVGHDGSRQVALSEFTHAIPAPPVITAPSLTTEDQAATSPIPPRGLTIRWQPVTETIDGEPVTLNGYEVIVTQVDFDAPNQLARPTYDVHVGPQTRRLAVPDGFLQPATLYEVEVLALERSGNQTITVGFFATR